MNILNLFRSYFRSYLARKFISYIVIFTLSITLILTGLQIIKDYLIDLKNMENSLSAVEKVHLNSLNQALWATNTKELTIQLEGIVRAPYLEHIIIEENGQIWAKAGEVKSTRIKEKSFPMIYHFQGRNIQIGTLTVIAGYDRIYSRLLGRAFLILGTNALMTFVLAAFMFVLFHYQVNRHLLTIADYLKGVDFQDSAKPLKLERESSGVHDELDLLAESINTMRIHSQESMNALMESEQKFHAIADYTVDWENWVDPTGKLLWINSSVERITGFTIEECFLMQDFPLPLIFAEDRPRVRNEYVKAIKGEPGSNLEFRLKRKDGSILWVAVSWQPLFGKKGEFLGHRSSVREISDRKKIELELQKKIQALEISEEIQYRLLQQSGQEQARMTSLLSAMSIGILFEDMQNRVVYYNPAFRRLWLIADNVDLTRKKTKEVMKHSANILSRPDHFSKFVLHVFGTHEVSDTFEIIMADGRVVTQLSYPVRDHEGRLIGRLWIYEDVTRERKTAEQLIYLAERDSLTGLFNRHRFQDELSRELAEVNRRNSHGCLLFFDLDDFKYVNDTFGHRAGDSMLIRVAGEVNNLVRRNEIFSRIGGDEFAILIPDSIESDAIQLADRIIRTIAQIPFRFDGHNFRLTTSLGIALYPKQGSDAEELVAHADAAMYQAKEAGKNSWRIYRLDLDGSQEMMQRMTWNERLSNAMENDLLRLYFQGVYGTVDGSFSHLEALVRLIDETDKERVIMPGHFISIAEKTGKILEIDRWVIRESIRILKSLPNLSAIAINISGRSFDDRELPQFIANTLSTNDVTPSRLMVELTETSAVGDLHDAQRFIEALHLTGCRVCLDDFGTGFSSFAYLKHLKADILKIDGLFIRDLPNDHDNQVFVKSIVDVARGMRKITIAEFVEDAETLAMLKQFGVDYVQGYFLDMPSPNHAMLIDG